MCPLSYCHVHYLGLEIIYVVMMMMMMIVLKSLFLLYMVETFLYAVLFLIND